MTPLLNQLGLHSPLSLELLFWLAGTVIVWLSLNALRAIYGEYVKLWFRSCVEPRIKKWLRKRKGSAVNSTSSTSAVEDDLRLRLVVALTEKDRLEGELIQLRVRLSEKWVTKAPDPDPYRQFDL